MHSSSPGDLSNNSWIHSPENECYIAPIQLFTFIWQMFLRDLTEYLGIAGAKGTQTSPNDVFNVLTSLNRNFWSSGTDSRGLLQ